MLSGPNPPNRRGTDPYARWCGRGGIARCPPIPIDRREHAAPIASGRNHIIPLDQQQSIFETAASRPPQDEGFFSMLSKNYLMLRSAQRACPRLDLGARLEARTASLQLIC